MTILGVQNVHLLIKQRNNVEFINLLVKMQEFNNHI